MNLLYMEYDHFGRLVREAYDLSKWSAHVSINMINGRLWFYVELSAQDESTKTFLCNYGANKEI